MDHGINRGIRYIIQIHPGGNNEIGDLRDQISHRHQVHQAVYSSSCKITHQNDKIRHCD